MPNMPDAVILCGGAGLRLRTVTGDGPKSMAAVAGRPFLELPLKQLRRHGYTRVILAVGYQSDSIRNHFGNAAFGLSLEYSAETSPLGTGGALRNAIDMIRSEETLVMNGDSYTDADLRRFETEHGAAGADASVLVVPADGRGDCGLVAVAPTGDVVRFKEKQGSTGARYLNAGIYMMTRHLLGEIDPGIRVSLEEELFPRWIADGKTIKAFVFQGACIDIGTPARYQGAQDSLASVEIDGVTRRPGS
jgi:NDP-sugar pyrophosphorylase family protein